MTRNFTLLIFFWLVIVSCTMGQSSGRSIKSWMRLLSSKEDIPIEILENVAADIMQLDSSTRCITYQQLETAAARKNEIALIRARILQHYLVFNGMDCADFAKFTEVMAMAIQDAYEIENEFLQFQLHILLGKYYNGQRQFGLASMHYHQLFEILRRGNIQSVFLPASVYCELNFSLYYTQEYEASIKAGLSALHALQDDPFPPSDTLDVFYRMLVWNTMGLAYQKLQRPDSAFWAFEEAEQLARDQQSLFWVGIIRGNKGDVYFDQGQYDTAYALLQFDISQSLASDQFDNAANSLQWLARIDLKNNNPQEALQKLYKALQYLRRTPEANYQANVYYAFSQVYTTLGKADSVNAYLGQYLNLRDSIQAEIVKSRTDILEMRLVNQEQIMQIKMLNRQKKQILTARNYTVALLFLSACTGLLWYSRQRQKMLSRQEVVLKEKQLAEAEAAKAIGQLGIYRQHLLEKNVLIEKWQAAAESKEHTQEHHKRLAELTHHLILSDDDWYQFKTLFDSVYPGFFVSLRNRVPDITQSEQRMAALSKLRLTAKEAANLLGVSPNTIYKTRQRLRQRLGLEQDSDLDPFFAEGNF